MYQLLKKIMKTFEFKAFEFEKQKKKHTVDVKMSL